MKPITLSIVFIFFIINSCTIRTNYHDELLTGNQAADFMEILFINSKITAAYEFLLPKFKNEYPLKKLNDEFGKMAKKTQIITLEAISFEIIDDYCDIAIYLYASNENATEYFRVMMRGNKKGYKVASITVISDLPKLNREQSKNYQEMNVTIRRGV